MVIRVRVARRLDDQTYFGVVANGAADNFHLTIGEKFFRHHPSSGGVTNQIWPMPVSRNVNASSTVRTITIFDAPFARVTAVVVKARKTSMTATEPVARVAPSRRLWSEISITVSVSS